MHTGACIIVWWGMVNKKTAFITGIAGQDGAYLAELLLDKGYEVHGLLRWDSYVDQRDGAGRLFDLDIVSEISLHMGDLTDAQSLTGIIKKIRPSEIYNLAALSQVGVSFDVPASTLDINVKGTLAVLEAVRLLDMVETTRIYQASSSEMFGCAPAPQNENTPMQPCSPYGASKLAAYWLARTYRDAYGLYAANGILFNHESPLRGEDFVTRKITRAVAKIYEGSGEPLILGNLDSVRDWGHARDYVRGMWMMLQQDEAQDFVLATGQSKTVREFVEKAFAHIDIEIEWRGFGVRQVGCDAKNDRVLVRINENLFRPKEVNYLLGDASKAREILGWHSSYDFNALVAEMVDEDIDLLQENTSLKDDGKCRKVG